MRISWIAVSVALLVADPASAQQTRPQPSRELPPAQLRCGSFTAADPNGRYGDAIEVQVTRSNSTPPIPNDYTIVGGRCDFQAHDAVPDMVRIQWQKSIPDGFSCKAGPAGSTSFVTTVATVYACGVVNAPVDAPPVDASPTSTKPFGELAVVARRGTAFRKRLKYDYRICNVDAASGLNVAWHDRVTGGSHAGMNAKTVPAGFCMELGAATYIQIQASNPGDPSLHTYYGRYPRNSFARGSRIVSLPPGGPQLPPPGEPLPGARPMTARCEPLLRADRGPGDQTPQMSCRVPLPEWGSHRICFSENIVDRKDDPSAHWWPAKFLPMVLDHKLIGRPVDPNDANWNVVLPNTCRDYYDVVEAYVIVSGDANYSAKNVSAVHMTVAPLK